MSIPVRQALESLSARQLGTVLLVIFLAPFIVFAVPQAVGANHGYVVLSDSMSPTLHAGDVVIVEDVPTSEIQKGDVITYEQAESGGPNRITHRVVEVVEKDDGTYFRTKGDANEEADQQLVPASAVVGEVMFHIPLIGHVIAFAGSDMGLIVFVVVPSVLLIVTEVWDLVKAARADPGDD